MLAVALLAVAAATVAFGRLDTGRGAGTTVPQMSAPAPTATAAPTVAANVPPTAPPPTAPPPTAPPPTTSGRTVAPAPQTIGELTLLLEAFPGSFGERADDLSKELSRIDGNSANDARRARQLLERAAGWVEEGELEPGLLPVLDVLIGPLAATADGANGDGGNGGNGDDD